MFQISGDPAEDQNGIRRVLRLDAQGLHVGDNQQTTEVFIDSDTVNIKRRNSAPFSTFGGNYVQFGDYTIRRTSDNGLAFKRG